MRQLRLLMIVILLGLSLAPAGAKALRIGLQDDPDVLDPAQSRTLTGRIVFAALCDKLVDISPSLDIVPQLAQSWQYSDGGTILKMQLRHDVKFHDGEPFNADAVVYNIKRSISLPVSVRKSELSSVADVTSDGAFEVTFKLKQPDASFLAQLTDRSGMMVSPKAAEAMGADFGRKPVCAGPFKFSERVSQDRIVLEKFDDYWDKDKISIDRVTYLPIPDSTVRFANLRSGSLDMIERMAATDVASVKGDNALDAEKAVGLGYMGLYFNINNGARSKTAINSNKLVRQAFSLSIDRDVIRQVVFEGGIDIGNQPWSAHSKWYNPHFPVQPRDIDKAKALLVQAGVAGKPIDVEITHSNSSVVTQMMQIIQSMAAEAGFRVTLRATEYATLLDQGETGNFEVLAKDWSGRIDPDGNIHWFITCNGGNNIGHYCNSAVDEHLHQGRRLLDEPARIAEYNAASDVYMDELPVIYLGHTAYIFGIRKNVEGFTPYPDGLIRFQGVRIK